MEEGIWEVRPVPKACILSPPCAAAYGEEAGRPKAHSQGGLSLHVGLPSWTLSRCPPRTLLLLSSLQLLGSEVKWLGR